MMEIKSLSWSKSSNGKALSTCFGTCLPVAFMVLTKTRNDLKRPETTYNKQETTWNDLNEQETNRNDLERAVNDLKWPTTSKTQPATTWTYQQQAKKDSKRPTTSRFWDYFAISVLFCSPPNIWLQSFEHCFIENLGENRGLNIYI